jgi:hypothetical protein
MAVGLHRTAVGARRAKPQPNDGEDRDHDKTGHDGDDHANVVLAGWRSWGTPLFKRRDDDSQRVPIDLTFPQP